MYEKFYRLKTTPFRLSPDPAFFFGSKGHRRALAYLRYGVNQKEGFIVITGTPGTGKTTLARALLGEMSKSKTVVSEINTTHLQADDVLRMVAASYGLPHENAPKSTLLKRLEEFFISRFRAGYHILLIIDESQNLPKESLEELRMLSNFYSGKDALVQIFLLGQEQFREQLYSQEMEQLRQRVVASCHLDPLDQTETKEYIQHRLKVAGWIGDPQISDRAFARIFSVTKGVPRRINTFCDRLMLYGALEDVHVFKDEEIKIVAKELSLETSPKDKDLSNIKPADAEDSVSVETLDTEHLTEFSDEVKEVVPPSEEEQDPLRMSQIAIEQESSEVAEDSMIEPTQPDRRKAVSNGEHMDASPEPLKINDKEQYQMDSRPEWLDLVALAVDYSSNPKRHKGITSSKNPLPKKGMTELFQVALGKIKIPVHLRTGSLEKLSDEVIQSAIHFYIKKVLLSSTADYYRRLGVERSAEQDLIRTHYKYLFRIFQPDKEANPDEWDETYTRRINQAYGALRSEQKRKEYDNFLDSLETRKEEKTAGEFSVTEERIPEARIPTVEPATGKRGGFPVLGTVLALLVLAAIGGGYYFYQSQQSSGFDISNIVDRFTDSVQMDESFEAPELTDSTDEEKMTKIIEDLPLEELPPQAELPKTLVQLPQEETSKIEPVDEKPVVDKPVIEKPAIKKPVAEKRVEKTASKPETVAKSPLQPEKTTKTKVEKAQPKEVKTPVVEKPRPAEKQTVVTQEKTEPAKAEKITKPAEIVKPAENKLVTQATKSDKKETVEKPLALSERELNNFISRFTLSYEEGKIDNFIDLFTLDSATNDGVGRDLIQQDYEALFDSTEMRVIDLHELVWDINGNEATASGAFVVTVLRKGGDTMRKFNGNIKLDVVKNDDKIKIKGMYHAYGNEDI